MVIDPNLNGLFDWGGVLEFATGTHNSLTGLSLPGLAQWVPIPHLGLEGVMLTQNIWDLARRMKDAFLDA